FWKRDVLDPGPDLGDLFGQAVYERGAMTLQALRNRIGDEAFWTVLRTWVANHRHGNATTVEFIAVAEQVSDQDLGGFFEVWLENPERSARTGDGLSAERR